MMGPRDLIPGDRVTVPHKRLDGAFVTDWHRPAQVLWVRDGKVAVRYIDDPTKLEVVLREVIK